LLPYTRDLRSWIAWQFDRPDLGCGVVQVFRRPESPYQSAQFHLRGLDPAAKYLVTDFDKVDSPGTFTGSQLMNEGIEIQIETAPAAKIFTYAKG
jgi:alpha-galactosidase